MEEAQSLVPAVCLSGAEGVLVTRRDRIGPPVNRKRVVFQLVDDHSRFALATDVTWGEAGDGAIVVAKKGIAAHSVPERLLTDNGAALNPSRSGAVVRLVTFVGRIGVEPITGRPYKPTTQGQDERFHRPFDS